MDVNMIVRIGALLIAFINGVLTALGRNPLPVSDSTAYEVLSILAAVGAAAWNAYKNNNFTVAAKVAQRVLLAIKSGKITAEKVLEFLGE